MLPVTMGVAYIAGVVEVVVVELLTALVFFGGAAWVLELGLWRTSPCCWFGGPNTCGEVVAERSSSVWSGLLLFGSSGCKLVPLAGLYGFGKGLTYSRSS